jgi:hypothetical protein
MNALIRVITTFLLIVTTLLLEFYLLEHYPNTGLARIVSIPFTIIWTIIIILFANFILKKVQSVYLIVFIAILFISLNFISAIFLWPQDGGPPTTWEQMFEGKIRGRD